MAGKRGRASIMEYFEDLEEPRADRGKRHQLLDMIAITLYAVICRADNWAHAAIFGGVRKSGFAPFWNCPTEFRPMTPSETFSLD